MAARIAVIGTGAAPTGGIVPPAEIAAMARDGFKPQLIETALSIFPATPYQRGLAVLAYVEAGIRAERAGYDAVFINTFGDYGLTELKSALSIPVIGAGEAALSLAATLGRRFAIVTIWPPSLNFIYDERLAASGLGARCAGVVNVLSELEMNRRGQAEDPVAAMRAARADMIDRLSAAALAAVRERGADTIVLGCTCMAPIGALIAARVPVPVIEPMTAGYAAAEMMLSLRLTQSKIAFASPPAAALDVAAQLVAGAPVAAAEECGACVIASAAE